MIQDPNRLEALQKLPALKGPALSIMVALMIAQRPLQAIELKSFTGYGNQAITDGIRTLSTFQAVVNLGHGRGYQLASVWRQMMLPVQAVDHENHDQRKSYPQPIHSVDHENHDRDHENHDRDHENHDQARPHGGGGLNHNHNQDWFKPPPPPNGLDHDFHDQAVKNQSCGESTPPSSTAPEITARSGSPEITAVAYWLDRAGIDAGSHNWGKIIALGQKSDYVKAHVLELLASQAGISGEEIGTGALIYRLMRNWKAPAMRCETCLYPQHNCQCEEARLERKIPAEYRDIIRR